MSRLPCVRLVALVLSVAAIAGCRSSETSVTGPSGSKCTISLSFGAGVISAAGGSASIGVTTGRECTWSASSSAAWITVGAANGQGSGSVPLTFAANPATTPRQGPVTVGGQTLVLTQAAATCQYQIDPQSVSAAGGATALQVAVVAQAGCAWTAVSNASWLAVTAGAAGSGNGQVTVAVEANPGGQRIGTVSVASQTFTVTQASGPLGCSYSLSPARQSVGAGGGAGSFTVSTAAGCTWSASSLVPWVSFSGATNGTGTGAVSFSVAANTGAARSGAITVAGETFTITQDSGSPSCTYAVNPTGRAFDQAGGSSTVSVTAPGGCEWTASTGVSWIQLTSGANGSGNGTVVFTVDVNPGAARNATLTVAGQAVQVSQSGCSYSIAPTSASIGAGGGPGSIAVTAQGGCRWTAASNDAWITITSGDSGTGAGTVSFAVAANTGAARSGSLTVAGQRFTVSQAEAVVTCTYTVSPLADSVPAGVGSRSVQVTAPAGCTWSASSGASWLRITSGTSGSGSGSVGYDFEANPSSAQRQGTLTVAGQTVTVTQAGATCTYTLNPTSQSFPAGGGTGTITVTAPGGCVWTAQSGAAWISITSGATGAGGGTVAFSVAGNVTGASRTGSITIQGQAFTITQSP